MKTIMALAVALLLVVATVSMVQIPAYAQSASCAQWLDHDINRLNSNEVIDLCEEVGERPVLLVNTASYCGFTYQFTALESLYQRYKDKGLVIVGFPSDDFNQEDDDASVTAEVCYVNHGVTFPMTEAVNVKGGDAHPVFAHLASEQREPAWNFNKYLVNSEGEVVQYFDSRVEPESDEMIAALESLL